MLQPGDVLKVVVWRNQELSGDIVVGADGTLRHPLYKAIQVAGVPLGTVEARLRQFIDTYQKDAPFVIEPMFHVAVGGEVRTPNLLSLPRETTIAQAIALAGGATTAGRLDKVRLRRGGREYKIDLTDPRGEWADAPIQSGDEIIVGRGSSFMQSVFLPLVGVAGAIASIINVARR